MEGEKVHLLMIKKVDAPRASPRRFWSPGCDSAAVPRLWLCVIQKNRMRCPGITRTVLIQNWTALTALSQCRDAPAAGRGPKRSPELCKGLPV